MNKKQDINWWNVKFCNKKNIKSLFFAFKKKYISQGTITNKFERILANFLKVKYVVSVNSGSNALLIILLALNLKKNDEILIPDRCWISVAHACALLKLKLKIVDVKKDIPLINTNKIEEKITKKTRVIIPVHMGGRGADLIKINQIARKYKIKVIEDACQALGSKNSLGLLGTKSFASYFSLSVAKIISSGQGGFIATNNKNFYKRLILLRTHGVKNILRVEKWGQLGFNFKYTDIQASIAINEFGEITKRKKRLVEIYKTYFNAFKNYKFIKIIPVDLSIGEIPLYVEALCKNRKNLLNFLYKNKIDCRAFYPSIHTAYYLNSHSNSFVNSEKFSKYGFYLPSGPTLKKEEQYRIINLIKKYFEK